MGFSVRKEDVRREKADNSEWQRKWVCSKQGFRKEKWKNLTNRKKTPRAITRTAAKTELHFLRSNRAIPECIGAQVMSMRRSGIRTCHILNHLARERGGREYLPFMKKDLYNWIGRQRRQEAEEGETDAEGALGYQECLGLRDPHFYETHTIDKDFRLADLFWADGNCRRDYNLFGEIMAFDTTYRKNAYNKPLLIFVGVNHHFRTIVFVVALLYDEMEETYIWVLQEFLECMKNKAPRVIVTDGDHAMANAIKVVMPQDLVGQVDAAIQNIRHTEREDDFISNHTSPNIPTNVLHQYYQQVASILTRTMYEKVAEQISSALSYSVVSADVTVNSRSYYLTRFPKGLVRSQVNYDTDHGHINCTCMLFESDGIPCHHIFAVMKHLNIPCIPDFLFKARWRKDAKSSVELNGFPHSRVPADVLVCTRWGSLTSRFNAMGYFATKQSDTYEEAMNEMSRLEEKFKSMCFQFCNQSGDANIEQNENHSHPSNRVIRDPALIRTKGREPNKKSKGKEKEHDNKVANKRRCRNCNELGHNRATCKVQPQIQMTQQFQPFSKFPSTEASVCCGFIQPGESNDDGNNDTSTPW
ncbi:protein FAR1-RELATED SEQUENCE 5-like [Humulus lupulus]|uniref:protein FAR1-RELATED SEQUENCE 5-like n=1 Tax=Humulus lupulus TaxID=3486 RepID=UPI002B4133EC|nr:protein FAR1-RELATED SEQUENCE 5-like [Humulus lupulus]